VKPRPENRAGGESEYACTQRVCTFFGDRRIAPNEYQLWWGFCQDHDWPFTRCSFEFRVRAMDSHRVIDVVGETEEVVYLFELKRKGNLEALGQLLAYKVLYLEQHWTIKPIKLVLVCHEVERGLHNIFHAYGVKMVLVSDPQTGGRESGSHQEHVGDRQEVGLGHTG